MVMVNQKGSNSLEELEVNPVRNEKSDKEKDLFTAFKAVSQHLDKNYVGTIKELLKVSKFFSEFTKQVLFSHGHLLSDDDLEEIAGHNPRKDGTPTDYIYAIALLKRIKA